ncbi:MAG TPA: hypothetical protein DCO72_02840 [Ruminococcus sp.]|nr:hypothetical protein [Ruminococcus sp.]
MKKLRGRFTIGKKMYLFICLILLTAVIGTAVISYSISASQIDRFYKSTTLSTAENFASMLDSNFLAVLREEVSTDTYQKVLSQAEEETNDELIRDYETAGVIQLDIRSNDEIQDIYQEIHTMQTNIIDYLNSLSVLQKDKEQAELDIRERDMQIGKISQEAYRDALTGVGSKAAYVQKLEELNAAVTEGTVEFAIVMVDMNNLKKVNDEHGHKNGDFYIKGCCHLICETFKHSPVFRIGGDEFVAILQGSDYTHRKEYVEKLRKAYTEAFENTEQEPWQRYSASVGTADYASDDSTIELVFKRADRAMYEDKKAFHMKYGSYR